MQIKLHSQAVALCRCFTRRSGGVHRRFLQLLHCNKWWAGDVEKGLGGLPGAGLWGVADGSVGAPASTSCVGRCLVVAQPADPAHRGGGLGPDVADHGAGRASRMAGKAVGRPGQELPPAQMGGHRRDRAGAAALRAAAVAQPAGRLGRSPGAHATRGLVAQHLPPPGRGDGGMGRVVSRGHAGPHALAAVPVPRLALPAQAAGRGVPGAGVSCRGADTTRLVGAACGCAGGPVHAGGSVVRRALAGRGHRAQPPPCGPRGQRVATRGRRAGGGLPGQPRQRVAAHGGAVCVCQVCQGRRRAPFHLAQRRPGRRHAALRDQGTGRPHGAAAFAGAPGATGGHRGAVWLLRLPQRQRAGAGMGGCRHWRHAVRGLARIPAVHPRAGTPGAPVLLHTPCGRGGVCRAHGRAVRASAQRDAGDPLQR